MEVIDSKRVLSLHLGVIFHQSSTMESKQIKCYEVIIFQGDWEVHPTPVDFDPTAGAESPLSASNQATRVYEPTDSRIATAFPNCIIKIRSGGLWPPELEEFFFSKDLKGPYSSLRPWCPQIHRVFKVGDIYYILEDKMEGKTLYKVLQELKNNSSNECESKRKEAKEKRGRILMNVLERFKSLHKLNLWHGDMNFGNILIDSKETVSFIDFVSVDNDPSSEYDSEKWKNQYEDCNAIFAYVSRYEIPDECLSAWRMYMNSLVKKTYRKKRKNTHT